MGFGFDLSFDDGNSFVSGPGAEGSALRYTGFNPQSGFTYDSFFDSDGDKISGILDFSNPGLSGQGILLGTLSFEAFAALEETIFLSADDYGSNFSCEGLVPGMIAGHSDSILTNSPSAILTPGATPIPEPSTFGLLGFGLLLLTGLGKRLRLA